MLFWSVPTCSGLLRYILCRSVFTNYNFTECLNLQIYLKGTFVFDFITKWGECYFKLGQLSVLESRKI